MNKAIKVALIGNPNSGKSSLFNSLTGLKQKVGNFPGVTVDRKSGSFKLDNGTIVRLTDLPGCYSLYPSSQDEKITADVLRSPENEDHPDLAIIVADVTNLKRSLLLCTQVMDLQVPVLLCLNMADLMKKQGVEVNEKLLSEKLGIPVIKISALKGDGLDGIKKELGKEFNHVPPFFKVPDQFRNVLDEVKSLSNARCDYLAWQMLLRNDEFGDQAKALEKIAASGGIEHPEEFASNEFAVRYDRIDNILLETSKKEAEKQNYSQKLDSILMHKFWGYVIFIGILALVFQALFAWASYPMEWIDLAFGKSGQWFESIFPDSFVVDLLVNGIWAGLGGIIIFIPQIAFLFFFIALLEESGYMSRVVFLMDRIMRPFGFSGKSVIPLIGGMACAIPSIMMARNIPNKYERLITIMVTPLMSCSARIPVYTLLIGMFVPAIKILGIFNMQGLVMLGMYFLGFAMSLFVAYILKLILRYKADGIFITELPIYRSPRWNNVLLTMYNKSKTFVVEAGKIILVISILLWFLASFAPGNRFEEIENNYLPLIEAAGLEEDRTVIEIQLASDKLKASYAGVIGSFIEPVIRPMGFDWKIGIALITSFAAREVFVGTMATIYSVGDEGGNFASLSSMMKAERHPDGSPVYTTAVAIALLLFYAFAMQCMSTLAVVKKETGSWKWTGAMLIYMTGLAYICAFAAYQLFSL